MPTTVSRTGGEPSAPACDGDGRVAARRGRRPVHPVAANTLVLVLLPDGSVAIARGAEQTRVVNETSVTTSSTPSRCARSQRGRDEPGPTRVDIGGRRRHLPGRGQIPSPTARARSWACSAEPVGAARQQLLAVVAGGTAIGLVLVGGGRHRADPPQPARRWTGSPPPPDGSRPSSWTPARWPSPSGCRAADADEHTEVGQVGLALNTHARQRRVGAARPPGERDAGAPVRRRREPRAAHPARVDPRLRRADPPRDRAGAARRSRTPSAGSSREALRMQVLVEDLLLLARLDCGSPARARARRPVPARRQRRQRRARRRTRPHLGAGPSRGARRGARRRRRGCTRSWPTCSPTPARTPRPAPGSSPGCGRRARSCGSP